MENEIEDKAETEVSSRRHTVSEAFLRRLSSWSGVLGTLALAGFFFGLLVYHSVKATPASQGWLLAIIEAHYAATVGIPLAAVTAFSVVQMLRASNGPIEFKAPGFEFRGASGPVVLWVFCFLAVAAMFCLLWDKTTTAHQPPVTVPAAAPSAAAGSAPEAKPLPPPATAPAAP